MHWLRFPRTLGIVVCLYLLGMAALFAFLSQQSTRFVRQAARTDGVVVALVARAPVGSTREPPPSARAVSLAPQVRYTVVGRMYEYTAAHGRFRQRLQVGDHVQVLYDPVNPEQARLRGEGRVLVPGIAGVFVLAALAVVVVLVRTRHLGVREPPG